jgi:probable phosphoglycerate mutase
MECWLVRHGESTWDSERRFQGAQDAPLSAQGRAQASALAVSLAATRFDAIYASPLSRARDTAAACGARLGLEAVVLDELREISLGDWEGLTLDVVQARAGEYYRRWLEAPVDHPAPGGEPMAGVAARVTSVLARLAAAHPDGRVLVVAHGGVIASALCGWLGQPLNAIWTFRLANASVTRVMLPAGRLLALNEIGHLQDLAHAAATP